MLACAAWSLRVPPSVRYVSLEIEAEVRSGGALSAQGCLALNRQVVRIEAYARARTELSKSSLGLRPAGAPMVHLWRTGGLFQRQSMPRLPNASARLRSLSRLGP